MNTKSTESNSKRLYFLDNLRTFIIFLVVLYHAGGVYESAGVWQEFWLVVDPMTTDLTGILNLVIDTFIMATMFFISGYFTPMSLKKGISTFLRKRLNRLIIPWLLATLILIPMYRFIFLYSRDLPQENWMSYFHFFDAAPSGMSWLWFLPVLFAFNLAYIGLKSLKLERIPFGYAVAATIVVNMLLAYSLDLMDLRGWIYTPLIDFQRERLLMYFMAFLLGTIAYHQHIFDVKPTRYRLYNIVSYTSWIPITTYIAFLLIPFIMEDGTLISVAVDRLIFWISFYATGAMLAYTAVMVFWRYLDKPGKIWSELSHNSYNVYIIHVVVIGALGLALLPLQLPALIKFLLLTAGTYLLSNLLASIARRISQPLQVNVAQLSEQKAV